MKAMWFGKFFPNIFSLSHKISEFLANHIARPVKFGVVAEQKSLFTRSLSPYACFCINSRRALAAVAMTVLLVFFAYEKVHAEAFLINQTISQAVLTNPGVGEAAANRRATESELRQTQGTLLPQVRLGSSIGPEKFTQSVRPKPANNGVWETAGKSPSLSGKFFSTVLHRYTRSGGSRRGWTLRRFGFSNAPN